MEKSTIENSMRECESAIRSLKLNPLPQDIVLIGELVNYWLKSFNLLAILKNTCKNEKEENNQQ